MNDKQEGILFTIDCLNSHKYNFDYNLEELIKEAKQLQSNWNSLREWLESDNQVYFCNQTRQNGKAFETGFKFGLAVVLDKMNELEGDNNGIMD